MFTSLLYIKKMENKTELRLYAKNIRKNLNISKVSQNAVNLIRKHPFYIDASNVMIFYPTKYEVNFLDLLSDNKKFYLPKVSGKNLLICPYDLNCELVKSEFNILEPCSNPISIDKLDLVIVPALMADKFGFRLGYGGGFYDRFLADKDKKFKTITVVPYELYIEKLPVDEFDRKIDEILIAWKTGLSILSPVS